MSPFLGLPTPVLFTMFLLALLLFGLGIFSSM
jgi:hypothetical protein